MAFVTALFVLTTTGPVETVLQTTGETRLVVDCKVNPAALVGHVKITFAPERIIVSWGGGNERLNTVPLYELPPADAVPYRALADKINPACGVAPSGLFVKLCNVVKVCAVTRPAGIKPRPAISAGRRNRFLMHVFIG